MAQVDIPGQTNDIEAQNLVISNWGELVKRELRVSTSGFQRGKEGTVQRKGHTERKLTDSFSIKKRLTYGSITGLSIVFERHGVFVHRGVGNGYKIEGGMVIRNAKSVQSMVIRDRIPHEWFNPVIQRTVPELADKLAEINADAMVNATRMTIR